MLFKDYIFNLLPPYFRETDSYKDVDSKGLLQRYLESIGNYWDNNLVPFLENVYDVYLTPTQSGKFLNNIASNKGGLPQGILNDVIYTKILINWIYILKIKSTKLSYIRLFYLYNPSLVLVIIENFPDCNPRDTGDLNRDNDDSFRDLCCRNCYNYQLEIKYDSIPDLTIFEAECRFLINLIEPINQKLTSLTFTNLVPTITTTVPGMGGTQHVEFVVNGVPHVVGDSPL